MSYTPPLGNGANLSFYFDYSPPAGNNANLTWQNVFFIKSVSTTSFVGVGVAEQLFAIQSGSTSYFEHPYRNFAISSGSTASFDTWLRSFSIYTASDTVFRLGAIFTQSTSSSLFVSARDLQSRAPSIAASSQNSFIGFSVHNATYSVTKSASVTRFQGGRNYDSKMVCSGITTASLSPRAICDSLFAGITKTEVSFRAQALARASIDEESRSAAYFSSAYGLASNFSMSGNSSIYSAALSVVPSFYGFSSYSIVDMRGDYTQSIVSSTDKEADTVLVCTVRKPVFVLTV